MKHHPWCDFPRCDCRGWCRYSTVPQQMAELGRAKQACTFPTCNCRKACSYMAHLYPDPESCPVRQINRLEPERRWDGVDDVAVRAAIGTPCPYCGIRMTKRQPRGWTSVLPDLYPTRDHVDPVGKKGKRAPENVVLVCSRCNNDKANLTPEQWYFKLKADGDPRAWHVARFLKTWRPGGAPRSEVGDDRSPES